MTIRAATLADADAVTELLVASYGALLSGGYDTDLLARCLPLITRANPTLLACGTWYVAVDGDGALVGCGGWTRERPGTGDVEAGLAHVRHFGTHPLHVRRGIGRALAERSFTDASAAGVTRYECYSTLPAERFYASLGFERVREMSVPMGPDLALPGVLMRRGSG